MQSYRFIVWTRKTNAFRQREEEEESEIWWNIYEHVYDAIQMQVAESLILNGDHIKSFIPPTRKTWTLRDHVFLNEKLEEYMKNICKSQLRSLIIVETNQDVDFGIITG